MTISMPKRSMHAFALLGLLAVQAAPVHAAPAAITQEEALSRRELQEAIGDLKLRLRDQDKWVRKRAVESLAKLGTPGAWSLVIGALADLNGEVSDTAQYLLARIDSADVLDELYGKNGLRSRDEWVSLRAAEVLGRVRIEVDGEALIGELSRRSPEMRRTLLWSVERLARAGNLGGDIAKRIQPAIDKEVRRGRDPRVRAGALFALAAIDSAAARPLTIDALNSREGAVRVGALALAVSVLGEGAEDAAMRCVADPEVPVRLQAIQVLAALGTRSAAQTLVARLSSEDDERVSWSLLDRLREISGLKHRLDPRPWRRWAAGLDEDWKALDTSGKGNAKGDDEDQTAAFAGLPVRSKRVCFLIDLSGSIWRERSDGRTRKEIVDEKLREVLESLPADAEFNLIPYTAKPIPWNDRLAPAKASNVKKATAFFEKINSGGTGNFWDAVLLALTDPRVDTIVTLTDGSPTGGRRYHLGLIVPLLEESNRTRHVVFDSILVDSSKKLQRYWSDLAAISDGRSIAIDLD